MMRRQAQQRGWTGVVPLMTLVSGILSAGAGEAATYYIAPSGGSGCSTTQNAPSGNIAASLGCLRPGDTLYFRAGTYNCSNCLDGMPGGNSSNRVTVAATPGETVTIKLQSSGNGINFNTNSRSFITFDGLRFDASGVGAAGLKITCDGGGDYSHHIRLVNVELFGAGTQGILANAGQCNASNQGSNEVIDSDIHHNGSDQQFDHGLYFASSNNVIENTRIHDNSGCGVHIYASSGSANRNVVRNNRAYGHTGSCGVGILMGSGDENMAYNNLVYGNNGGIMVGNGGQGNQVYNNTVVNNQQWCLRNDNSATTIRNTICFGNPNNGVNGGGSGTVSDNLFGDPKFVNAGSGDYHLQSGSPAIKAGLDLSSLFTTDIEGKTRPAGKFDLGAYAVGGTGGGPTGLPAPRNLRVISIP